MRPSGYSQELEREIARTSCEVCGEYTSPRKRYCDECEQYKKMAENAAKLKKRAKAFGRIL